MLYELSDQQVKDIKKMIGEVNIPAKEARRIVAIYEALENCVNTKTDEGGFPNVPNSFKHP